MLLFKMRVVLQKHEGGRVQGLVEVEVGRNVAADVTMVLMRENAAIVHIIAQIGHGGKAADIVVID